MSVLIYVICGYMQYFYGRFAVALLLFALGCKMYAILVNACLGHGITLNTGGSYSIAFDKRATGSLGSGRLYHFGYRDEYGIIYDAKKRDGNMYMM